MAFISSPLVLSQAVCVEARLIQLHAYPPLTEFYGTGNTFKWMNIISNNNSKIVIKAEALREVCSYCKWTSFWQCSASPRTQPASSTTAAPVSSQLVSIPKTSLWKRCFPEWAELVLSHAARPCFTYRKTLLAMLFIVYNLPGAYV